MILYRKIYRILMKDQHIQQQNLTLFIVSFIFWEEKGSIIWFCFNVLLYVHMQKIKAKRHIDRCTWTFFSINSVIQIIFWKNK